MSKQGYLLDSVILIEHLNGIEHSSQWIEKHAEDCFISIITRMEVLSGYSRMECATAKSYLDSFQVKELTIEVSDLIAHLRFEHRWKLPDAIQAGLAQFYGLKLATRNTKDFPPGKYSFICVP